MNSDNPLLLLVAFVFGVGVGALGLFSVAWLRAANDEQRDEILPHHQPDFVDRDLIRDASRRAK